MEEFHHLSVLAREVMEQLAPRPGGTYLDGTLGGGGHSELILEKIGPDGLLIGIDRDPAALAAASERLRRFGSCFRPLQGSFGDLAELLKQEGINTLDGLLLDLGVSSHQLDTDERGFSFRLDGPLDMRMDRSCGDSAADLLQDCSAGELEQIIKEFGEERWAKKIALRIVQTRQETPITTTLQLADLVAGTIPRRFHEERIHPATRTFQALRIAVNQELEQVEQGIRAGIAALKAGGRIAVISFHSLEDRIVKHLFREAATGCTCPPRMPYCVCNKKPQLRILTGRPVIAGPEETDRNPRARSAKLRAAEKLG
ncbi:16S rRNA (cytosine(1402)-N(4))-methyltransferase RsmH [Trichlorobacter lovleyi]|uniref:Ribosomal RNA small subunit methyltransferase H n=1 Tax=Trichlorobacter lovleyi (strain ATCC BAA-1151 / DSM 17278 / SZ) TaxID=398767 RepID=RSMH_TRIL1|nr:16S rRNA (cytosine(1402)-N(4))-methyltransferase RsmH [Trichlorobacter lovleyi]B3E3Z0.1 RecName: Full=Ribosomal RNA small subunit methyltransferase H; AltName: Full=16S rRNA m(4)C1402 methyltransferase; AltName: Full=rRNA (cytosine-N(4)-)-methyltransferase RsmH [Trichlorobacter lovleyi SZ]ACD94404.1 S-adenosyl-methyltransferase MraW [Trichlorobacter lovleyi SZ]